MSEISVPPGSYTSAFTVGRSAEDVYATIMAVRDWWDGEIDGSAAQLGDEFTYRFKDFHTSRQRVTELVPGRRIVWHVIDGSINFVADRSEWSGTDIVFDITPIASGSTVRITHAGLVPAKECFEACSGGWTQYFGGSLKAVVEASPVRQTA